MGSSFNKIVPEIIQSSIWNEESDIRIVWITMIATKDEHGYVRGDARTLARMANVSVESTEKALKRFQEPDQNSHTPDHEGRRILPASGGWSVINSDVYREIGMSEQSKEYWREKKRLQRLKKKENVQDMSKTCPRLVLDSSVSVSVSNVSVLDKGVQGEKIEEDSEQIEFNQIFEELSNQLYFVKNWHEWLKVRSKKRATNTTHAKLLAIRILIQRKERAVEYLEEAICRGWIGVKWDWLDGKQMASKQSKPAHQQTATFHSTGDEYLKSKGLI